MNKKQFTHSCDIFLSYTVQALPRCTVAFTSCSKALTGHIIKVCDGILEDLLVMFPHEAGTGIKFALLLS